MKTGIRMSAVLALAGLLIAVAVPAQAEHSWGSYHWARTTNPLQLGLGDNVTSKWDAHLATASFDWTQSSVIDTKIVPGRVKNVNRCSPQTGKVEICNASYGFNGWLGIAGISLSGGHIVSGYVKLNDSYFDTATYNTPAWRNLVMCQEVGHIFGLDHQDEVFDNANLGTCMDYTNDPVANQHPNQHDYDHLAAIYNHLDTTNTSSTSSASSTGKSTRSRVVNVDSRGNGTVTHIYWVGRG